MKGLYKVPEWRDASTARQWAAIIALVLGVPSLFLISNDMAHVIHDPHIIGSPDFGQLYSPFKAIDWIQWLFSNPGRYANAFFLRYSIIGGILIGTTYAAAVGAFRYQYARAAGPPDSHGSARLARIDEIQKAGLLDRTHGTIVCEVRDDRFGLIPRYREVVASPELHTLICAPPRSGKTRTHILKNALRWSGPLVTYDVRGDIEKAVSGYRARKYRHVQGRVDPYAKPDTEGVFRINPLRGIPWGTDDEDSALDNQIELLQSRDGSAEGGKASQTEAHFQIHSANLLFALIKHNHYAEPIERQHYGIIFDFVADAAKGNRAGVLSAMMTAIHDPYYLDPDRSMGWEDDQGNPTPHCPDVVKAAQVIGLMEGPEQSGVFGTVLRYLSPWKNRLVRYNTAETTVPLDRLKKDLDLFFRVRLKDRKSLRRVIALQISCLLTEFLDEPLKEDEQRVKFQIDEFDAFGRVSIVEENMQVLGGNGCTLDLVVQGMNQIYATYTNEEKITLACAVLIFFAVNDLPSMRYVNTLAGRTTIREKRPGAKPPWHDFGRDLVMVDEARRFPRKKCAVFHEGLQMIYGEKRQVDFIRAYRSVMNLPRLSTKELAKLDQEWTKGKQEDVPDEDVATDVEPDGRVPATRATLDAARAADVNAEIPFPTPMPAPKPTPPPTAAQSAPPQQPRPTSSNRAPGVRMDRPAEATSPATRVGAGTEATNEYVPPPSFSAF